MKWTSTIGITFVVAFIILYEWPQLKVNQKNEKIFLPIICGIGWLLAILLVHFPDMPGPTQIVQSIFKPLSKILEK